MRLRWFGLWEELFEAFGGGAGWGGRYRVFDLDGPATALIWLDRRRLLVASRAGSLRVIDTGGP